MRQRRLRLRRTEHATHCDGPSGGAGSWRLDRAAARPARGWNSRAWAVGTACLLALVLASLLGPLAGDSAAQRPESRVPVKPQSLPSGRHALSEASELLARVASLTIPSVVHIQSIRRTPYGRKVEETGSGVIIHHENPSGDYVVTNRHVIVGHTALGDISIHLHDGRVLHPERVWEDPASDVAVMKITAANLQPARWGDSDQVKVGQMVLAVGSPFGLSHSVTFGIISAKGRRSLRLGEREAQELVNQDFLQTDAAINPGNSGGPLVDLEGRVIGINTAIASNGGGNEGIGFSIPSNLVRWVVEQLLQHGHVQRAYLGVTLDPDFNERKAALLHLDRVRGAYIQEVHPNTPASRANLKPGDVILSFDGIDVQDENHLINLVSLSPVGKKVQLVIWRDGKKLTIEVVLTARTFDQQTGLPRPPQRVPVRPGGGTFVRPMGLTVVELTPELARQAGYGTDRQGLLVLRVAADSPLRRRIRAGDLLQAVGGQPVRSVEQLLRLVSERQDEALLVRVCHAGETDGLEEELVLWDRTVDTRLVGSRKRTDT